MIGKRDNMDKNNKKKQSGMKFAVLLTLLAVGILVAIVVLTNQQSASPRGNRRSRYYGPANAW